MLGGENASFNQLFETLKKQTRQHKYIIKFPLPLMMIFSRIQKQTALFFNNQPLITPDWVRRYFYSWPVSSQKAVDHLNYKITPLNEGMGKTVEWLTNKKTNDI